MKQRLACLLLLFPSLLFAGETVSLFNGKDLEGWTMDVPARDKLTAANDIPIKDGIMTFDTRKGAWWNATPPSFIVRDGLLVSLGRPGGHLVTNEVFSNYKLVVEYRFSKEPGNCGVLVWRNAARARSPARPLAAMPPTPAASSI